MKDGRTRHPSRGRFLCLGMLLGAIIHTVFFVFVWTTSQFGYLGQESAEALAMVEQHYLPGYLIYNLKLLGYSFVSGAFAGLIGCLVIAAFRPRFFRTRLLWLFLVICLFDLLLLARSVQLSPQLYWEVYAGQGSARWLIDLVLDHVISDQINILLLIVTLMVLVGLKKLFSWRVALFVFCCLGGTLWFLNMPSKLVFTSSERPNIVLVVIDSLRSDRISGLGYQRQTTPNIDALIKQADVFPNTYVPLPRTLPSIVSMLTGKLPTQHGVRTMFPTAEERRLQHVALPQILQKHGYMTAVVSDYAGEMFRDINFGYQIVETPSFNFPAIYQQRSLEVQLLLLAWLNNPIGRSLLPGLELLPQNSAPDVLTDKALRVASELPQPFFLTVFYSATHFPYTAVYPDYTKFADPGYRGGFRFAVPYALDAEQQMEPKDHAQVNALYDGALHGVDRAVGRLLDRMEEDGLLGKSIVVLTGDHGESLYDRDSGLGHGDHFVGGLQSVRVPLFIARPNQVVSHLDERDFRMTDFLPTMVAVLGLANSTENQSDGLSVYSNNKSPRPVYVETGLWMSPLSTVPIAERRIAYPDILETGEIDFEHGDEVVLKGRYRDLVRTAKHRLLKTGPWVLVYMPTQRGVEYALYREDRDPSFTQDLADEFPDQLQSMRETLLALMATEPGVKIRNDFVVYETP